MSGRDRRDFLKVLGRRRGRRRHAAVGLRAARAIPTQEPAPPVRDPRYREWSTAALAEAKRLGCSYADIRFTRNRSQSLTIRNGQISTGRRRIRRRRIRRPRRRRHDRDLRLRHPRDPRRRLGLRQQPGRHARGNQARRRHRHRRRARQRHRQEDRRPAGAGREVRRVLADAVREGSVDGAARREGRAAARRDRGNPEDARHAVRQRARPASSTSGSISPRARARSSSRSSTSATAARRRRRGAARRSRRATTSGWPAPATSSWSSAICPARPSASRPKRSSIRRRSRSARASRI